MVDTIGERTQKGAQMHPEESEMPRNEGTTGLWRQMHRVRLT
jgi:hypothetical protein